MKKLFIALTILLSMSLNAQDKGWLFLDKDVMRLDHQQHFVASMSLSMPIYLIYETNPNNTEAEAILYTFGTVQGLGLIKEFTDSTGFDFTDIGANTVGNLVGITTTYFLRKWAKKRQARKTRQEKEIEKLKTMYNEN